MCIENQILASLLKRDFFSGKEPDFAEGLARRAVEHGYKSLSPAQKDVLDPFLNQICSGCKDPGGYNNGCEAELYGAELKDAIDYCDDVECLQCESCREETGYYRAQWQRIEDE